MKPVNWNRVTVFLALTFVLDWGFAAAVYAAGVRWGGLKTVAVGTLFMAGPAVAAFLTSTFVFKQDTVTALGLRPVLNHALLLALLAPLAVVAATVGVSLALPGVSWSNDGGNVLDRMAGLLTPQQMEQARTQLAGLGAPQMLMLGVLQAVAAGCTVNALASMGEEAGWRGYLDSELAPWGFWRRSVFTGVVWGVWHAPLILQGHNYPMHPQWGVGMMVLFCTLLAPPMALLRQESGCTWAPAVAHGIINGAAGLTLVVITGGDDLSTGLTGLPGLLVLLGVNVWMWQKGVGQETAPATRAI